MLSCYLQEVLNPVELDKRIKNVKKILHKNNLIDKFDSFLCTGISGISFAVPLGLKTNKNTILVRKYAENAHSFYHVEGEETSKKAVFVDDFISSGTTLSYVLGVMAGLGLNPQKQFCPAFKIEVAGIILYKNETCSYLSDLQQAINKGYAYNIIKEKPFLIFGDSSNLQWIK